MTTLTAARTLPRAGAYWTAAAVAAVALWTSAAPSTAYPLYGAAWHLTPAVTTAIFAVYPAALVVVLLVFGDLADHLGRRTTILLGVGAMLAGTLLFAVAPSVAWVFAGRVLMGVGVGLALSPASAAVAELSRPGRERAAGSVVTASTALGLALATLVGGALIQYAAFPLHLDFWVLAVVLVGVGVSAWFLPRHTRAEDVARWRPRAIHIAPGLGGVYVVSALAVSTAYMFGAVFLSLGADVAEELIHTRNVLVVGAVLALMSVLIGVTAVATRGVAPRRTVAAGSVTVLVAFALLLASASEQSLPLFLVTTVVAGSAYALLFSGGLGLVSRHAPAHHRAGTISAVYLVAYVLQGATAIALGLVATSDGLSRALLVGAVGAGVVAIATFAASVRDHRNAPALATE
ncbi:MAG: MFS transporter [Promicromonosporaceae bacterium]|nr:MFS transporter [Promicromonosporaceae bacterium]